MVFLPLGCVPTPELCPTPPERMLWAVRDDRVEVVVARLIKQAVSKGRAVLERHTLVSPFPNTVQDVKAHCFLYHCPGKRRVDLARAQVVVRFNSEISG